MTDVATEHALYEAEQGRTPAEVLASIDVPSPHYRQPDWEDVRLALSFRHRQACEELLVRERGRAA